MNAELGGFIKEKKLNAQQLRAVTPKNKEEQKEIFKAYSILFDEVIERLPASGRLLARIKNEYEKAIATIQSRGHVRAKKEQSGLLKTCELSTINNYHKRIAELDFKSMKLKLDNERIKGKMDEMNAEIEALIREKEHKRHLMRVATPRMTSSKRKSLGLSLEEATSLTQLQLELKRVREELDEVKIISEKKFILPDRKAQLHKLLNDKEQVKAKVDKTNSVLAQQLKKLKLATQAVASYCSYLQQHRLDPQTLPLEHYIAAVIEANYEEMQDEEPDQDLVKETEAEMVLDCFEKFNELFESERYEEAALHAASSPKGVLRTMDTLNKFKHSARLTLGTKPPLLCYCEHLMACAPAYRPLSKEEGLECVQCALDNDGIAIISHWIAQGVLYPSVEVGSLLMSFCKCVNRCTCGCMRTAFSVLDRCGEHNTAALCLVHQDKFMTFFSYAKKIGYSKIDYIHTLSSRPSMVLVEALTHPPDNACMTTIEAANILLQNGRSEDATTLIRKDVHELNDGSLQTLLENSTQDDTWQILIANLHSAGFSELAIECLSALTMRKALLSAVTNLTKEFTDHPHPHPEESVQDRPETSNDDDESSLSSSEVTDSEYESSGGYSSELESDSVRSYKC
ncbi:clathrin heavy chain linker domain-containing protein 1-like isoform X2 [Halichondria panicea]|uniref:clathrin heavy chain linker domain-containing protein 1-like isoform X2 n=1 Tax=Halichondria panicea TaxID=6063 RepID=UPI00312B37C0